jgi:hypothetical protein
MRRFGVGGFDALNFDALDGLRNFLLQHLEPGQLPALFQYDVVELVVLVFEMGEMGFQLFEAFGEFFVHVDNINAVKNRKQRTTTDGPGKRI